MLYEVITEYLEGKTLRHSMNDIGIQRALEVRDARVAEVDEVLRNNFV